MPYTAEEMPDPEIRDVTPKNQQPGQSQQPAGQNKHIDIKQLREFLELSKKVASKLTAEQAEYAKSLEDGLKKMPASRFDELMAVLKGYEQDIQEERKEKEEELKSYDPMGEDTGQEPTFEDDGIIVDEEELPKGVL
jgi:hypothetical protein